MTISRFLPATLLIFASVAVAPAGQKASSDISQLRSAVLSPPDALDTPHLSVRLSTSSPTAAPGALVTLFADVSPKPRMHVYAPDQKDYIPISLTLERDAAIRPAAPRYPKAETYFFAPLKETQRVYSKPFRVALDVTIAATPEVRGRARAGATQTITGALRYQACDDTICYMPKNMSLSWTVTLTEKPKP